MNARLRRRLGNASTYLVLLLVMAFFLLPIIWFIETAFKPRVLTFAIPPVWFFQPVIENFVAVFKQVPVLAYLRNSVVIATGATALAVCLGVPAGYGLARHPGRSSNALALGLLIVRMVPPVAMLLPFYLLMRNFHLIGTYWAVILLDAVLNVSFAAWFMRGYYQGIPPSMEEAAYCDGATGLGAFIRVALPLGFPGTVTIGLLSFIASWNDFLMAMLLTARTTRTLPLGILETYHTYEITWNLMAPISLVAVIPVLILGFALQRYYVAGLTLGAVRE